MHSVVRVPNTTRVHCTKRPIQARNARLQVRATSSYRDSDPIGTTTIVQPLDATNPNVVSMYVEHRNDCYVRRQIIDPGCSLTTYMSLPSDQFVLVDLPGGARMERVDNQGCFRLVVPRISLFDIWVEPSFYVHVGMEQTPQGPAVVLQTGEVSLRGTEWIDNINARVQFRGTTRLQWEDSQQALKIFAETSIVTLADPPMPISLLPKSIIKATVETVIKGIVMTLQAPFIEAIGRDYNKWSTSEAYRRQRQGM